MSNTASCRAPVAAKESRNARPITTGVVPDRFSPASERVGVPLRRNPNTAVSSSTNAPDSKFEDSTTPVNATTGHNRKLANRASKHHDHSRLSATPTSSAAEKMSTAA
jgi:hypothetical protein